MQKYDATLKLLLRSSAPVAIQQLAGAAIAEWLDTELPLVRNARADLVGRDANGRLFHIELQSTNDPDMPIRMACYCLDIRRLHGALPRQILVYVGRDAPNMETELHGPDFLCRYTLVDFRSLDGDRLLASPNIADNLLAILARLRDHKEAIRTIVERIAGLEGSARQEALSQLLILAGLRNLEGEVEKETRHMPVIIDILENKVLGREYKRGLAEGKAELVRRMIEARFGPLPEWAGGQLAASDPARIDALALRLLQAATLDDLFA
jgi:hypothetical protein